MEYGKYLYQEQKKQKAGRGGQKSELKMVRFSVRTSGADLEFRANQVDKFLKKRYKVRIQMTLKGREKALRDFANKRLTNFLSLIKESYKTDQEPKSFPMGIYLVISRA
jgi:translation initiation factor IF-3